jgi:hypothetical protein
MHTHLEEFTRLALLVQRILDAETLSDGEGAALLTEIELARQGLEEDSGEAARDHVEKLARLTEALLAIAALAPADGRAVLHAANRILNPETDAGE